MNEIILKLKDKDDKAAYEYSKILRAESAESDKYLHMIPEFAGMPYFTIYLIPRSFISVS